MKLDRKSRDDFHSFVLTVERALQTFLIHFFFNLSGTLWELVEWGKSDNAVWGSELRLDTSLLAELVGSDTIELSVSLDGNHFCTI